MSRAKAKPLREPRGEGKSRGLANFSRVAFFPHPISEFQRVTRQASTIPTALKVAAFSMIITFFLRSSTEVCFVEKILHVTEKGGLAEDRFEKFFDRCLSLLPPSLLHAQLLLSHLGEDPSSPQPTKVLWHDGTFGKWHQDQRFHVDRSFHIFLSRTRTKGLPLQPLEFD